MANKGLWIKSKKTNIPQNRQLLDSKWVFKKKRYVQFSACLVARGYTQIPLV